MGVKAPPKAGLLPPFHNPRQESSPNPNEVVIGIWTVFQVSDLTSLRIWANLDLGLASSAEHHVAGRMLELCGSLLSLAFLAGLCGTVNGPSRPPPCTAAYLIGFALLSLLGTLGTVPSDLLLLQVALPEGQFASDQLQPWQPFSVFFWVDGLGAGFALQLWLFTIYSSALERLHCSHSPGGFGAVSVLKYAAVLCAGASLILLQCLAFRTVEPLALGHALTFFVVGLLARAEPNRAVRACGVSVRWCFVPWLLVVAFLPLTGIHAATCNVLGVVASLAYDTAIGLAPSPSATPPAGPGAKPASPSGKPHSGTEGRGYRGGGGRPSSGSSARAAAKASPTGRERWVYTSQVVLALVLVLYHGGSKPSDFRSERTGEMAYCRSLRQAMDPAAPMVAQLVKKFSEVSLKPLTADASGIFAMWAFAAEHWGQAVQQQSSSTNINNISSSDPEILRQVVAQAFARSEIPEEMSDEDLVPEVLNLMGMNRLVVKPDVVPHFSAAIASYRRHRHRTAALWTTIKRFVNSGGHDGLTVRAPPRPCPDLHP